MDIENRYLWEMDGFEETENMKYILHMT